MMHAAEGYPRRQTEIIVESALAAILPMLAPTFNSSADHFQAAL
jgi:hypothetical protein